MKDLFYIIAICHYFIILNEKAIVNYPHVIILFLKDIPHYP